MLVLYDSNDISIFGKVGGPHKIWTVALFPEQRTLKYLCGFNKVFHLRKGYVLSSTLRYCFIAIKEIQIGWTIIMITSKCASVFLFKEGPIYKALPVNFGIAFSIT